MKQLCNFFIFQYFDYCLEVWGRTYLEVWGRAYLEIWDRTYLELWDRTYANNVNQDYSMQKNAIRIFNM